MRHLPLPVRIRHVVWLLFGTDRARVGPTADRGVRVTPFRTVRRSFAVRVPTGFRTANRMVRPHGWTTRPDLPDHRETAGSKPGDGGRMGRHRGHHHPRRFARSGRERSGRFPSGSRGSDVRYADRPVAYPTALSTTCPSAHPGGERRHAQHHPQLSGRGVTTVLDPSIRAPRETIASTPSRHSVHRPNIAENPGGTMLDQKSRAHR